MKATLRAKRSSLAMIREFDELATAVSIFNQGMDFAGEQIDPGVKIFMPANREKPVIVPYIETAGIFWMKNRDPQHWRDSQLLEHVLGKYIISDLPMSEEDWARERATVIDAEATQVLPKQTEIAGLAFALKPFYALFVETLDALTKSITPSVPVRVPWAAWNRPRQSAWLPSRRRKSEK